MLAPNRKLMRSALNRAASNGNGQKNVNGNGSHRIANGQVTNGKHFPPGTLNYARCYDEDLFVMLPGGQPTMDMMKNPTKWALYYLPEGCNPRFHIIGEDSDWYALRNLVVRTIEPKARYHFEVMLIAWKERGPFSREHVRTCFANLERMYG